jgi:hypothetical protein
MLKLRLRGDKLQAEKKKSHLVREAAVFSLDSALPWSPRGWAQKHTGEAKENMVRNKGLRQRQKTRAEKLTAKRQECQPEGRRQPFLPMCLVPLLEGK